MRKMWIALGLLAGCSNEAGSGNQAQPSTRPAKVEPASKSPPLERLTGLYEGRGDPAHQMCVVESGDGLRFGLVVWGGNDHSCSGSGRITRDGDQVKLVMAGDSACTLSGSIVGKAIRLADDQPSGCSYYCGARARLAGAELTQVGDTKADASRARDLVGEPLCLNL